MKHRFTLVLWLALVAGCCSSKVPPPRAGVAAPAPPSKERSRPRPVVLAFHVDKDFGDLAFAILQRAAMVWKTYSKGLMTIELEKDLDTSNADLVGAYLGAVPTVLSMLSTDSVVAAQDESTRERCKSCSTLGLTVRGPVYQPTVMFVMDRLEEPRDFFEVALHEFGHAFGMGHVADEASILHASHVLLSPHCPSKPDMEEFCRALRCELSDVTWCE